MSAAKSQSKNNKTNVYLTNPFTLGIEGVKLLYNKGRGVFWLALAAGILGLITNSVPAPSEESDTQSLSGQEAVGVLILIFFVLAALLALFVIVWGMFGYTSSELTKNKHVKFSDAFKVSYKNFWRIALVIVIMSLRIIGWTLLLIIPGIIMSVRYTLSAVVIFAEPGLSAGQVVTRSAELTKKAWFDTFASQTLLSVLSFGILSSNIQTGVQAILYKQLSELKKSGSEKPPTHWLSYLCFGILLLIFLFFAFLISLLAMTIS